MVRLVDGGKRSVPEGWESDGEKHADRKVVINDGMKSVDMEFWW